MLSTVAIVVSCYAYPVTVKIIDCHRETWYLHCALVENSPNEIASWQVVRQNNSPDEVDKRKIEYYETIVLLVDDHDNVTEITCKRGDTFIKFIPQRHEANKCFSLLDWDIPITTRSPRRMLFTYFDLNVKNLTASLVVYYWDKIMAWKVGNFFQSHDNFEIIGKDSGIRNISRVQTSFKVIQTDDLNLPQSSFHFVKVRHNIYLNGTFTEMIVGISHTVFLSDLNLISRQCPKEINPIPSVYPDVPMEEKIKTLCPKGCSLALIKKEVSNLEVDEIGCRAFEPEYSKEWWRCGRTGQVAYWNVENDEELARLYFGPALRQIVFSVDSRMEMQLQCNDDFDSKNHIVVWQKFDMMTKQFDDIPNAGHSNYYNLGNHAPLYQAYRCSNWKIDKLITKREFYVVSPVNVLIQNVSKHGDKDTDIFCHPLTVIGNPAVNPALRLMRWTSSSPDRYLVALDCRFHTLKSTASQWPYDVAPFACPVSAVAGISVTLNEKTLSWYQQLTTKHLGNHYHVLVELSRNYILDSLKKKSGGYLANDDFNGVINVTQIFGNGHAVVFGPVLTFDNLRDIIPQTTTVIAMIDNALYSRATKMLHFTIHLVFICVLVMNA